MGCRFPWSFLSVWRYTVRMNSDLPPQEGTEERPELTESGGSTAQPQQGEIRDGSSEPMLWCPVCSTRLTPLKCKLVCEKCGYYMSCSDYY